MGGSSTTLSIVLKLVDDASAAMASVGSKLESVGRSMSSVGRTLTTDVTLPIVGIGFAAAKAATDFEASMTLIQTQAGASANEVKNMSKAILDMVAAGEDHTPKELSEALFHIESTGLRGAQALQALKAAAEGASVGQTDLEGVTNALAGAIQSGIKGTSDYEETMAALNSIVGAGNMRMGDLVGALSTGILPAARSAGVSLQDVGAAIALMSSNGIPAEEAATRLRMTMALMEAPTNKAAKALEQVGISSSLLADDMRSKGLTFAVQDLENHLVNSGKTATEQAQIIERAFGGGRTSSAILTLTQNADKLGETFGRVKDGVGAWAADVQAESETTQHKFQEAQAKMAAASIQLGAALLPLVADIMPKLVAAVTWLVNAFTSLPKPVQDTILVGLGLLAVLGPILLVVGSLITVVGTLMTVFVAIGPIIMAIGVFIAGLSAPVLILIALIALLAYYVITHWNQIKEGTQVMWDAIKSVIKSAVDYVVGIITGMYDTVMGIVNKIIAAVSSVTGAVSRIGGNISTGFSTALTLVPHFAAGGIVTGPTLGLIGEAGPEAIIPLSQLGAAGGTSINITVTGNTISSQLDVRGIAQAVGAEIVRTLRLNQRVTA